MILFIITSCILVLASFITLDFNKTLIKQGTSIILKRFTEFFFQTFSEKRHFIKDEAGKGCSPNRQPAIASELWVAG